MRNTDPRLQLTDEEVKQAVANIVRQPVEDIAHYIVLVQTQDHLTIWRGPPPGIKARKKEDAIRGSAAMTALELTSYLNALLSIVLEITDPVE